MTEHDSIVVLGAQVRPDGTPSQTLKRRLLLALEVWRKTPVPIVCCGAKGRDEPETEACFMARFLAENGVPHAALLLEDASYDTIQNIRNAKILLQKSGLSKPLLPPGARVTVVTSDYHLPRAKTICRKEKLSLAGGRGSRSRLAYLPKSCAREILAWGKFILVYFLRYS